ncbi:MAG: tRNA uridine-5-carboxymethylaminomethyl(34) synthesis enzyme MnmG [Phycisphaerae bacterium]|nr:tRNA uridine-5-carboxymethylaminomethyl(34) synthesis enzyme MnmG [Phycisphaerae bacterium]|tara:strand:+ start:3917 stop:5878 length:1962 start_codon:yes stop_codon:yes gene_type:complete
MAPTEHSYDVIVIGGGHAGTEAAWAAAGVLRGRGRVALVTMDPSRIGTMSCNPAIGGLAKGQMAREIDALGGLMGRAIDATGIMFKMLNTSKGPAVRGPRAQADKEAYRVEVQRLISEADNIDVIAGAVDDLVVESGAIIGIDLPPGSGVVHPRADRFDDDPDQAPRSIYPQAAGEEDRTARPSRLLSQSVVLTTGTFMRALMHTGGDSTPGGRVDEGSADGISGTLKRLGFQLGRLKTGTPPRLRRGSIEWDQLPDQRGDERPRPFSDLSPASLPGARFPRLDQVECRITSTTAEAHELIRGNLHRAPMYSGAVEAECGPRYCPSIEDKVVRFADRDSHHVFLEPESLHTDEIYCNGISTSLPRDVQERLVRTMPGCANAEILRWGYAVEYDMVWPHQIDATCMTKSIRGLFLAGQINGTSGYEEAGGQGLVAGLNAARLAVGDEPVRLGREQAYIGVMLDDLVTKTPREPYRMFTSRAEHRLLLRADNTDERLTPAGREWGIVCDRRWNVWLEREAALRRIAERIESGRVEGGAALRKLVMRPETSVEEVSRRLDETDGTSVERVMTSMRYEGYIARQRTAISRQQAADSKPIPGWIDPSKVTGLRSEAAEALARYRPSTLGQAGRLAGVSPADLTLLGVAIRKGRGRPTS